MDVSEVAAAQLLLQGELLLRQLPFVLQKRMQIWGVGLSLMEETHKPKHE